jgi:hypothetical protein
VRLPRLSVDKFQAVNGRLPVKVQIESSIRFKGSYYDRSLVSLKAYRRELYRVRERMPLKVMCGETLKHYYNQVYRAVQSVLARSDVSFKVSQNILTKALLKHFWARDFLSRNRSLVLSVRNFLIDIQRWALRRVSVSDSGFSGLVLEKLNALDLG